MACIRSDYYTDIAEQIIDKFTEHFHEFNINEILFLEDDKKKPKNKYASIKKVQPPYTFITSTKFIITIYEQNVIDAEFSEAQKHLLILNQLMLIDESFNKIVGYDVEGFKSILSIFSPYWDQMKNVEDILSDDFTATFQEEDNII